MNKHLRESLYSVTACVAVFAALALFFPEVEVGNTKLSFVSFKTDSTLIKQKQAKIIADSITEKLTRDTLIIRKLSKAVKIDSSFTLKNADSITLLNRIVNGSKDSTYHPLDRFFKALVEQRDTTIVRIAHYGDSQLEGDRITNHIRKNLQAKFGGGGPGYLSIEDPANSTTYMRTTRLITEYNCHNKRIKTGQYGIAGRVFKPTKAQDIIDSAGNTVTGIPFVSFMMNDFKNISKIKVLTGKSAKPIRIKITSNSKDSSVNQVVSAPGDSPLNILQAGAPGSVLKINLQFLEGEESVYGVMADGSDGVAVDNYAIRGHSGDGLMRIDDALLREQLSKTNTRLIIFQYGNNMIPYLKENCKYYQTGFEKLFMKYRNAVPDASILVIGNGDMGYVKGGESVSYPSAECLDAMLKEAAHNTGCAYWSMLKAMGGQGSIVTWTKKGLASLDGHLTNSGQKLISNLIFKAIMLEYNDFAAQYLNNALQAKTDIH